MRRGRSSSSLAAGPVSLSHFIGDTTIPLIEDTIGQNFKQVANEHRHRECLIVRHQNDRLSYEEVDDAVDRLASGRQRTC